MNRLTNGIFVALVFFTFYACQETSKNAEQIDKTDQGDFEYVLDRFADLQILRYKVAGFEDLDLPKKKLAYYLYQAALCGRDIIYDQNYKHNIRIRKTIEAIYNSYTGVKSGANWNKYEVYAKRIWFSNGIHHHYATTKIIPDFSEDYLAELINDSDESSLPLKGVEGKQGLIKLLSPIIYDPKLDSKRVNLESNADLLETSANNYYEGLTQSEAQEYYQSLKKEGDDNPPMYGLNSKLVKENGQLIEKVYRVGGLYSDAIVKK